MKIKKKTYHESISGGGRIAHVLLLCHLPRSESQLILYVDASFPFNKSRYRLGSTALLLQGYGQRSVSYDLGEHEERVITTFVVLGVRVSSRF